MSQPIIIIGAGISGLVAARELLRKGREVCILEARGRTGGRIHTLSDEWAHTIEAGAEFIHGNLPFTLDLMQEYGIGYHRIQGDMIRIEHGQPKTHHDFIEGWDELLKAMSRLKTDMPLGSFLSTRFSDEKYRELRNTATRYAEGFDLAGMERISTMALYKEWSHEEEEIYRVDGGYQRLVNALQKECVERGGRILLTHTVKSIRWKKHEVTITEQRGRIFTGEKALITVPLGILQSPESTAGIQFSPDIIGKKQAFAETGYGTVIKIILLFREPFWNKKSRHPGFFFINELIPTWWTQIPGNANMLTGWIGGSAALALKDKTDEMLLLAALQSLAAAFQEEYFLLETGLVKGYVFNWIKDPFALGAYSFPTPESSTAVKILQEPVEDTLFFAGEALYEGQSGGTVEAALISGLNAVKRITGKAHSTK